ICQMMGTSAAGMLRFKRMNRIDYKLAGWMFIGTVLGMEGGAQILEFLKNKGTLHLFHWSFPFLSVSMTLVYSVLLLWIGGIIYREAKASQQDGPMGSGAPPNQPAMTARLQHMQLPPMLSLPVSGIEAISLWVVLGVGLATGLLVGFLGAGGVFIRMPALVYVIGCPMVVAIGTDLLESIFSMGYGVLSHSLKGNIDFILMLVLLITGSLGNQIGSVLAKRTTNPLVRRGFAFIAFIVVLLLLGKLVI
ncbi:MAG TPA: sulfite exporter TauE/SafE family protein, partial [Thermodesulfobacteriota bacterium]|nr:sulfite exporter TauE/SafE family protein [Thermodesulfobacteriota bacterium]